MPGEFIGWRMGAALLMKAALVLSNSFVCVSVEIIKLLFVFFLLDVFLKKLF